MCIKQKDDDGNSVGLHHGQIFINDVTSGPAGNGWEIPLEYITREQQLGEGSFGKVAKGFIRGPVPGTYTMKDCIHASVAIKFLKGIVCLSSCKVHMRIDECH